MFSISILNKGETEANSSNHETEKEINGLEVKKMWKRIRSTTIEKSDIP